jgi:hypothetical protein
MKSIECQIVAVVIFVLSLTSWMQPLATAAPLPDRRPTAELSQDTVTRLREAWDRARNPKVLVTVGVIDGESVRFDDTSEPVKRLEKIVAGELARAFPGGVRDLEASRTQNGAVLDAMRRNMGGESAKELDDLVKRTFEVDIRVEIVLRRRDRGLYTESFSVRDLNDGSFIATESLNRENDILARVGIDKITGAFICDRFAGPFIEWSMNSVHTFEIKGFTQIKGGDDRERAMRLLTRDIERELGQDVKWAEVKTRQQSGILYVDLSVRYDGRLDDLLFDLEDRVLGRSNLAWNVITQEGRQAGVFIFPDTCPKWFSLTDAASETTLATNTARKAKVRGNRLGIVVGRDIADPEAYFEDKQVAASGAWDELALRAELVNTFTSAGMKVQADDSIRKKLAALRNNAERYQNAPNMIEALGELNEIDYLLHVNIVDDKTGSRFVARLIDPNDASEIGQQVWPAPDADQFVKYSIDASKPSEVARFVGGKLLERWDNRLADSSSTTLVRVLNHRGGTDVLGLINLLREGVSGVKDASDPQIASSSASFEIVHEGNSSEVLLRAIDRIGTAYPGVEVQILRGTIVVNMKPVVLDEAAVAAIRARQIALNPGDPAPEPLPPTTPQPIRSEQERLEDALRDVRDSVWLIYVETKGGAWTGTGWTVTDKLIATNAHVVGDVPERLAKGEPVTVVAFSDSGQTRRLVLGKAFRHPRWNGQSASSFFMDVGLFEVVAGDPGRPIPLAPAAHLDSLVAPIACGYVGFPGDGVIKAVDGLQNKQAFTGQISAIVDVSLVEAGGSINKVVMHNLQTSGGASGSPIIDAKGRVIGVHNSGGRSMIEMKTDGQAERQQGELVQYGHVNSGFNGGVRVDILARYMESLGFTPTYGDMAP